MPCPLAPAEDQRWLLCNQQNTELKPFQNQTVPVFLIVLNKFLLLSVIFMGQTKNYKQTGTQVVLAHFVILKHLSSIPNIFENKLYPMLIHNMIRFVLMKIWLK